METLWPGSFTVDPPKPRTTDQPFLPILAKRTWAKTWITIFLAGGIG
jgi:hypothetical protein